VKAFLLAAGLGTRLRPITDSIPKCLVEVGGRPMLDIWLDALAKAGVHEVLVNTHHLPGLVEAHVAERFSPPAVRLSHEPVLLGSAGTLLAHRDFVAGEDMFLAVYADNLTDFDLRVLIDAHTAESEIATLAVFRAPHPKQCGIVELDDEDRVVDFVEKPENPPSDLANAGMYAFHPSVLSEVPRSLPRDIGFDLLPRLVGRMKAVRVGNCSFLDIGTTAALERARREWEGGSTP
jgi:mannose-1-phosphate guanylyltransferase